MAIALKFTRYPPDHSIPERRGMPNYEILVGYGGVGSRGRAWVLKGYIYRLSVPQPLAGQARVWWLAHLVETPWRPLMNDTFAGIKRDVEAEFERGLGRFT